MGIRNGNLSNLQGSAPQHASDLLQMPAVPKALVLAALDASDQGILIISKDERVVYHNAAYARLRQIPPSQMVGHPLEELDRRSDVRELLRSGTLPRGKTVTFERRMHKESLVVVPDRQDHPMGVIVVVTPVAETARVAARATGRRSTCKVDGKPVWPARYIMADIIGNSPALIQVKKLALQAAQGGSSVLLLGESGTGKEMFAYAIHVASCRRDFPFVPVDCSAIPRELLEAELFGYAPGAFTGACKEGKPGKLELAYEGTILLDEIGEMPLELQSKLLRILQDRQIVRIGATAPIPASFKVIAATNRDLESLVAQGQFRRDLMYRLDIIRIEIPPLRERPEDIPLLVEYYWELKQRELGKEARLSAEALRVLEEYAWPGNVRELANLVERLLVTILKPLIEPQDLPPVFHQGQLSPSSFTPFQMQFIAADAERRALERALHQAKGNRNKAAQLVGLSRATLYRKLKQYNLTHLNCI